MSVRQAMQAQHSAAQQSALAAQDAQAGHLQQLHARLKAVEDWAPSQAKATSSWRESQDAKAQAAEERQQQLLSQNQHILAQQAALSSRLQSLYEGQSALEGRVSHLEGAKSSQQGMSDAPSLPASSRELSSFSHVQLDARITALEQDTKREQSSGRGHVPRGTASSDGTRNPFDLPLMRPPSEPSSGMRPSGSLSSAARPPAGRTSQLRSSESSQLPATTEAPRELGNAASLATSQPSISGPIHGSITSSDLLPSPSALSTFLSGVHIPRGPAPGSQEGPRPPVPFAEPARTAAGDREEL